MVSSKPKIEMTTITLASFLVRLVNMGLVYGNLNWMKRLLLESAVRPYITGNA